MAIFVDWDNSVYVADENKIKIYDKNGDLFQVLSENSMKGPGSIIADSAGKIYVECSRVSKVYVFSKQGEFIKSIDMPKYEEGLLYNFKTNRKFALYSPFCKTLNDPQIQGPIVPFTDNGIEAPSFGEPLQFDPRMRYDTGITMACKVLSDGRIAVSYLYPFAVQIYSANGVLQTVITRTDTLFTESFEFVLRGYRFKLSARRMNGIRSFPDGKFMIAYLDRGSDWKERAKKGDVSSYPGMIYDLYDSTGVFLQEFKQPRNVMGMLGPVDRKGFVYSTSYPKYPAKAGDFVINKYCIEFKDK
jgi:hypothetical protein